MALPKHVIQNVSETLSHLGLSDSEVKIFMYLLKFQGNQRVSTIARHTRVNRTTLYGILKSLSDRGLVSSIEDRGVLSYRSIEPSAIPQHIERLRARLAIDIRKVASAVAFIEKERSRTKGAFPVIQFFEGKEGIKQAYEDTIVHNPSKEVYGFTGTQAIYEGIDLDWVREYLVRRTKAGLRWRSIATNSPQSFSLKERDPKEARVTKILPKGYEFSIELSVYEDKVLIASFSKEHPLALLIEDPDIAQTMRELFRYIDSTLEA